jgi:phosphatidylglycerophosphate synthase
MQKQIAIPTFISTLRILALPPILYLYNQGNILVCLELLAFCAATDYLDGYSARKLCVASRFGGYYDAATDFILMLGLFIFFFTLGYYPIWLPVVIVFSFGQFIITSLCTKKLYDPVGRYLGSALYIGVVLTLLLPVPAVFAFVQYTFVGFLLVSLASRLASLKKTTNNPKLK